MFFPLVSPIQLIAHDWYQQESLGLYPQTSTDYKERKNEQKKEAHKEKLKKKNAYSYIERCFFVSS